MIYIEGGYDGQTILDMPLKEQSDLARQFSEGNKSLEVLLLGLWSRNIETVGCCAGHEFYDDIDGCLISSPAIGIRYNNNSKYYLSRVFAYIKNYAKCNAFMEVLVHNGDVVFFIKEEGLSDRKLFNDLNLINVKEIRKNKEFYYLELLINRIKNKNGTARYLIRENENSYDNPVFVSEEGFWRAYTFYFKKKESIVPSFFYNLNKKFLFSKNATSNLSIKPGILATPDKKRVVNRNGNLNINCSHKVLVKRKSSGNNSDKK